jgi:hypothetical protein
LRRDTGSLGWRQAVARLVTCEAAKGVSWVIRRLADQQRHAGALPGL